MSPTLWDVTIDISVGIGISFCCNGDGVGIINCDKEENKETKPNEVELCHKLYVVYPWCEEMLLIASK